MTDEKVVEHSRQLAYLRQLKTPTDTHESERFDDAYVRAEWETNRTRRMEANR